MVVVGGGRGGGVKVRGRCGGTKDRIGEQPTHKQRW